MIANATVGIEAARSRTRIDAFVADARLVLWTIGIQDAFGTASHVRIAHIIRRTEAGGLSVLLATLCVLTARRWIARTRLVRLTNRSFDYKVPSR